MPAFIPQRIYCERCNKFIDKYYFNYHCNTKKHLLGISKSLEPKLNKEFKQCVLIFN